jgi:hypothetical protein
VRGGRVLWAALAGVLATLAACGCGGGTRQDKNEPERSYTMRVVRARFPVVQPIARKATLELLVRNLSTRTAPNVAVTLDSFYYTEHYPELASNKRPIWVVEAGPGPVARPPVESQAISPPGGGQTVYVNTWALGPLGPGQTRAFLWRVAPVKPGLHTVHYAVTAGLAGKAKAETPAGRPVHGTLTAYITREPPQRHVDPRTGLVVPGREPLVP